MKSIPSIISFARTAAATAVFLAVSRFSVEAQGRIARPKLGCATISSDCFQCGLQFPNKASKTKYRSLSGTMWSITGSRVRWMQPNRKKIKLCDMPQQSYQAKFTFMDQGKRVTLRTLFDHTEVPPTPTSSPTNIPGTPGQPKITPTATPVATEVLDLANFEYLGSAALPKTAVGRSTGFSTGILAARKVNGELRFFTDTHIYSSGELYEFVVPGFGTGTSIPAASIKKEWGDIYGNSRVDSNGVPITYAITGLFWDKALGGLWWAGNPGYNTLHRTSPSAGVVLINGDTGFTPTAAQRFHIDGQSNNHWTRGCVIDVPARFAALFGNKNRAIGCGGYYSIIGGGSWGPALTVFDASKINERKIVLGYPEAGTRAPRPPDYFMAESAGSGSGWMGSNPVNGTGRWTGADEVGGEGTGGGSLFLDLPEGMGLLVWASHGQQRIGYDAGSITSTSRINRLYIYDPRHLVETYQGNREIALEPTRLFDWPIPPGYLQGRIAGAVQDPDDPHIFYILHTYAYKDGVEYYPVLHQYRIKPR